MQEIHFMPPTPETKQRVARTFTEVEFLVLLLACELDQAYFIKRNAIAELCPLIFKELTGPRLISKNPRLVITLSPFSVRYVDGTPEVDAGLVVPLSRILEIVSCINSKVGNMSDDVQGNLNFGPSLISLTSEREQIVAPAQAGNGTL
jgi:hypothetical protein